MPNPSKHYPCVGIRTSSDYSPFGVELDGRTVSGGYRFGFQNQEKDDEIKGEGNSINYTFRIHDPRLGRFFSRDRFEFKFNSHSPYHFAGNTPICSVDDNGDRLRLVTHFDNSATKLIYTEIKVVTSDYLTTDKLVNWIMPGTTIKNALADDCTFDSKKLPEKNGINTDYSIKYRIFDGITVTSEFNYFICIHKSNRSVFADFLEIVFHEFYHVLLFNKGIDGEKHHEKMGSIGVGNGIDSAKPIPEFRRQLKSSRSSIIAPVIIEPENKN